MTARQHAITPGFTRRISRRLTPLRARRDISFKLSRPIVSLSFDDFPQSVIDNACPHLDQYDWKATFYVAAGLAGTSNHLGLHFSVQDLKTLTTKGHEIGCHSYNHVNILEVSGAQLDAELNKNAQTLDALGIPKLTSFAYPYGEVDAAHKSSLETRFTAMRGIMPGIHYRKADLNQIKSMQVYSGPDIDRSIQAVNSLKDKPGWLTLFTHDVRENPSDYGCTPGEFERVLKAIKNSGAQVMPIGRTVQFLQNNTGPQTQHKGDNQ